MTRSGQTLVHYICATCFNIWTYFSFKTTGAPGGGGVDVARVSVGGGAWCTGRAAVGVKKERDSVTNYNIYTADQQYM